MCPAVGGALRGITEMEFVRQTVEALLARAGVDPADVDRLLIQTGGAVHSQRAPHTGVTWPVNELPARVPAITMDRWCGTGQEAVHQAARTIVAHRSDVVVVVGVESAQYQSNNEGVPGNPAGPHREVPADRDLQTTLRRVMAAELLTEKWAIGREALDEYAVRSHQRAAEVAASGEFNTEIVPIYASSDSTETGRLAVRDETIDSGATIEHLRALRPTLTDAVIAAQPPDLAWSITSGNTARRALGSAAVLLMSKLRAAQLGLHPRARLRGCTTARGDKALPLAASLRATEKVIAGSKVSLERIDHVEVDEEFACVPLAWCAEFPVSPDIFNPRGGALALGGARACGALRQMTTMLSALDATGGRFGLQTMNADAGHGYATLIERY